MGHIKLGTPRKSKGPWSDFLSQQRSGTLLARSAVEGAMTTSPPPILLLGAT